MFFPSRVEAGKLLAEKLVDRYRYENCAVVALDDGGVMVGAQIAAKLHCCLMYLTGVTVDIAVESLTVGGLTQDGDFAYNSDLPKYEIDEYQTEYRNYIEQEKMEKMHKLNRLLGDGGLITKDLLKGHTVILVSDGITKSIDLDLAVTFLRPIKTDALVVATPMATIKALDRMHVLADHIECLHVLDSALPKEHYYDLNDVPDHETIVHTIEKIVLKWS